MISIVIKRIGCALLAFLLAGIAGCGGGGSGGSSSPPASLPVTPPSAIELRVSPDLPTVVSGGDRTTLQVTAVSSTGAVTDVTASVQVETDTANRVQATMSNGWMTLSYANVPGSLALTLRAAGLSVSQTLTVNRTNLRLDVSDGYSGMTKAYGTDHYVSIVGRALMVAVQKIRPGNQTDVTQYAVVTSSDPSIVSVQPVVNPDGSIPWFTAFVHRSGTVSLTATIDDITTTERIVIPDALVVGATDASAIGLTEGPAGRLTAFFIASADPTDLAERRVVFASSVSDNQWGRLTLLQPPNTAPIPAYGLIPNVVKVAEAPNGFRAAVSTTNLGRAWVHLIDPNGNVRGPVDLADDLGEESSPVMVAVASNGDAHVWLFKPGTGIRRIFVNAATLLGRTISTAPMPTVASPMGFAVSIHPSGTVGLAWLESHCSLRYGFDTLALVSASPHPDSGSITLPGCDPTFVPPGISVAAGNSTLSVAVRIQTGFATSSVHLINVPVSGAPTLTLLDHDRGASWTSVPRVAMDASGASVTLWQTEDRGVWAAHTGAGAQPLAPFLVEAPFFTLATPTVDNVYPRGDGRFLLAWTGGQPGVRNRLEFRDYSVAQGLSDRQSMPYEVATATSTTALHASSTGISVIWSYWADINLAITSAVQNFLP